MFESAELGREISKAEFRRALPPLRESLLDAQYELSEGKRFSLVVLIGGVDGAGKGETVNVLNEWMDPRHIHTHAHGTPTEDEVQHPLAWRFWRTLPPKGKIGIFFGSWYTQPIIQRTFGLTRDADLDQSMDEIVRFEQMLRDEGVHMLKLWFHLGKAQQKKRLRALSKDARTRWRVTEQDWKHFEHYDEFREVSARALRHTSTGIAPWTVIEGLDARYRSLTAGRAVLEALRSGLSETAPVAAAPKAKQKTQTKALEPTLAAKRSSKNEGVPNLLNALDQRTRVGERLYDERLEELQGKLALLTRKKRFHERGVVAVFEGADAAGKGGAIRRITQALDARFYRVNPVAAPSSEEKAQPYLWRFWRQIPTRGHVAIFDRSWYGRVLVERVEGFCSERDWSRAYAEINDFESQLIDHGLVVVKFWLHIDAKEQLRRFREREATGFKRFKITEEDWRNRKRWGDYETAACDMFDRTSTEIAPWTIVPANDKRRARLMVLETLIERVERALEKR